MVTNGRRRDRIAGGATFLTILALAAGVGAPVASAAGQPEVVETWASSVFASSVHLNARINPHESFTTYHFEYISKAAYDANVAASKEPFSGALRIPVSSDGSVGSGGAPVTVLQQPSGLAVNTTYYYRVAAKNGFTSPNYKYTEPPLTFTTQGSGEAVLADSRGWEMVSPVDKNGGQAGAPGAIADGGTLQASAAGGSVTYSSEASFAGGGAGAPPASQYIATRSSVGWSAQNISPPLFAGGYDSEEVGVPYQLFSGDLARGLLLNGAHCRGEGTNCAVANPPLAGTGAPEGFQDYYLRDNGSSSFTALLSSANSGFLSLDPAHFDLSLAGTAPDLTHGVISTCAALTATATQVPLGEGCDATKQNLYEYGSGALSLINTTPGAKLAAQSGAVSSNGARVYWEDTSHNLFLHEGSANEPLGTGTFQTASANGEFAFYIDGSNHLQRYDAVSHTSTDLAPGGGVTGVLGASEAGDYVYYKDAAGLELWHNASTLVAPAADASDYPPVTGTARVSPDGTKLLFVSTVPLTTSAGNKYDNKDVGTETPDSEVYLYDAGGPTLTCVSCNPTNGRPSGSSTIPGAIANGSAPGSIDSYKPRALSANGKRAFFDSGDALVSSDSNGDPDAYEWEAQGEGTCSKAGGCISLLSDGSAPGGSRFVDASANGGDAFFLTEGSLVGADLGALDLYDARVGGGFAEPTPPILCEGDACYPLTPEPVDPTLTTLQEGPGNPAVRYPKQAKKCKKGSVKRHGKCVKKARSKRHAGGGR
jgi:hypothetical protein